MCCKPEDKKTGPFDIFLHLLCDGPAGKGPFYHEGQGMQKKCLKNLGVTGTASVALCRSIFTLALHGQVCGGGGGRWA
jgi:hypothetical protein